MAYLFFTAPKAKRVASMARDNTIRVVMDWAGNERGYLVGDTAYKDYVSYVLSFPAPGDLNVRALTPTEIEAL